MTKVRLYHDNVLEREFDPGDRDWRIGRGTANDVVLIDPTRSISRFQAEIRREQARWWILDLNSQNGSWIEGKRIQREPLTDGTTVVFGEYRLVFEDVAGAAPSPAPPGAPAPVAATMVMRPPVAAIAHVPAAPVPTPAVVTPAVVTLAAARGAGVRPSAQASGGSIIVRLLRLPRPVLFGAFAAFTLLVMGLSMALRPSSATPAASPAPSAETGDTGRADPNAAFIELHMQEGRTQASAGDCAGAIRDHLNRILLVDATHSAAAELKARCEEQIRVAAATSAKPADPAPAARVATRSSTAPTGGPGAPPRAAAPPARVVDEGNADAVAMSRIRAALGRQDFVAARGAALALLKRTPHDLQAKALLAEAEAGNQRSATRELEAGSRLERDGDLAEAMRAYERAGQLAPDLAGVSEAMARVRQQAIGEGEAAYARARQYHSLGRLPEAMAWYEKAARLLPASDARRTDALARLAELKGQR